MPSEATARWTENRPTRGLRAVGLRELWTYRELVYFLALRDVKARYKQAAFGVGWALVQPVAGVALFTVVFHHLASVQSDGLPYAVFALAGYLVWTYIAATVNTATVSLVENSELVTKVYFPRLAAPLSALLPGLVNLVPGLFLLALLMAHYGVAPGIELLAAPLGLLAMMAVALGAGLLLATLNVRYRDVGSVLGTLVQLWLFASPVAYSAAAIHGGWRWLYAANPVAGTLELTRWILTGHPHPSATWLVSAATGLVLLGIGVVAFASTERRFADVI